MPTTQPIWIGNDHGGYDLKIAIVAELEKRGLAVRDVGSHSGQIVGTPTTPPRWPAPSPTAGPSGAS